jgi:uncharacterized protein (TIGR02145 family)/uncharacterized repeat protein (TIGR02059 family)
VTIKYLLNKVAKIILIAFSLISIYSCKKDELLRQAKVQTLSVSEIMAITAKAEGDLIDLGTGITEHGHCWGLSANPVITDFHNSLGAASKTGSYKSALQNLVSAKLYHVRAYAKTSEGLVYGTDRTFTTLDQPKPVYFSVANAAPSILEITFSSALANIVPAASTFTVMVNSVTRTVSLVTLSGSTVKLTLLYPIVYGDIVTVSYTEPASNPLQSTSSIKVATFTAQSVTNIVSAAVPAYVSSSVENATPAILEMTYSQSLAAVIPATFTFTVQVNLAVRTVTSVAINGTKVQLTLSSPVVYGDAVTVAYTQPASNPLQTTQGGKAVTIGSQPVTNNVAAPIPTYVSSSVENATPSLLEMTHNQALAGVVPNSSAFTVQVNLAVRTVTSVTISGSKVQLTLSSPVVYGDAVTVAYTQPASNPLQTTQGGKAVTIGSQNVINNVGAIAPVYVSSSVENANPLLLEMTYSQALAGVVPNSSAFSVQVNLAVRTVTSVTISGTKVQLTLSSPIVYGDAVTVAYNQPASNPLQTTQGGKAVTIGSQTVTNNVGAIAPAYVSSSVENSTPSMLELIYNLSLAGIVPDPTAFSVQVNLAVRTVTSVTISGTKVRLTLSSPVVYGDAVTVAYTQPASNPLQTTQGGKAVTIGSQPVTNNVAAPIPTYVSASVENATPSILEMTYSQSLAAVIPATFTFTVQVNLAVRTVTSVTISGTKVQLTISSPVVYGDAVTVAYNQPASNPLQTTQGGKAVTIGNQNVTNNVALASLSYVSSVVEDANPNLVQIVFNLTLANIVPPAYAFTIMANSVPANVNAVSVTGKTVQLTLALPVNYGDIVTVAYTKPVTNPVQTSTGDQVPSIATRTVTNNCLTVPTVGTTDVTSRTTSSAIAGGTIIGDGGSPVTVKGLCWGTSPNPSVSGSNSDSGSGSDSFTGNITGLAANTVCYFRAYATNSKGTGYGEQMTFLTFTGTVTDMDNNTYYTVVIGTQLWMAQNLKTTKYRDGSTIPLKTDNTEWANLVTPGYCWYNNDAATYKNPYGALYNWYAVSTGVLCPTGWHVPTDADWTVLTDYLGGEAGAGGKLKETGTTHWLSPNTGATNETGFTALPGGKRAINSIYNEIGYNGVWWSSSESFLAGQTWKRGVNLNYSSVSRYDNDKTEGNSVRCLQGEMPVSPSLTTTALSNLTVSSVETGGNIISDGGVPITEKGVCWSTSPGPIRDLGTKTIAGSGTGAFTSSISGLSPATIYYARAYATNSQGTGYGAEITFTTLGAAPTVTTGSLTVISTSSATVTGTVNANYFYTVIIFEYGTSTGYGNTIAAAPNTTTGNTAVDVSSAITGLSAGTTYHYRIRANNALGTTYGNDITFTTAPVSVNDVEGNTYNVVGIGTQVWMAENLKTTKYNDNTAIPLVTDNTVWRALTTPGYCWYNNDEATNKATYGALYNWYTVDAASNGGKNVCPKSWHVPFDAEWTTLTNYLGGEAIAGGKLKEIGTTHWLSPNTGATNETGFTALPGGFHDSGGGFSPNDNGHWWSSTGDLYRNIYYNLDNVGRWNNISPKYGLSVRCIRDF